MMKTKFLPLSTWLIFCCSLPSCSHARPEYAPLLTRSDADSSKQLFVASRDVYHSSLQIISDEVYVRVQIVDRAALLAFEKATLEIYEPSSQRRMNSLVACATQPDKTMLLEFNVPKAWAKHCVLRIWPPKYLEAADRLDFAGFELSCGDIIAK